jgi:hypothetical protein
MPAYPYQRTGDLQKAIQQILGTLNIGVLGTTTNDNAPAGYVGEYVSASVASGSAISLVNITAKTITSISLTAGDWDVDGYMGFLPSGGAATEYDWGSSTTNNTFGPEGTALDLQGTFASGSANLFGLNTVRYSLAATTTVYLVGYAAFAGTCKAYGGIRSRRVR